MERLILAILLIIALSSKAYGEISLDIIRQIESSGGKQTYNRKSGAIGEYQITDICRRDFNQCTGKNVGRNDLRDKKINRRIAEWYIRKRLPQILKRNGVQITEERILASYNGGYRRVVRGKRLPKETREYIEKYKREEKRRGKIK